MLRRDMLTSITAGSGEYILLKGCPSRVISMPRDSPRTVTESRHIPAILLIRFICPAPKFWLVKEREAWDIAFMEV